MISRSVTFSILDFRKIMANVDGECEFPVTRKPYYEKFKSVVFDHEKGIVHVTVAVNGELPLKLEWLRIKG